MVIILPLVYVAQGKIALTTYLFPALFFPAYCSGGVFHDRPQTRAEFKERADLELTRSLEKEKVRDYFLDSNDGWQMQALTRDFEEDESDKRKRIESVESDRVRDGDKRRQGLFVYRYFAYNIQYVTDLLRNWNSEFGSTFLFARKLGKPQLT